MVAIQKVLLVTSSMVVAIMMVRDEANKVLPTRVEIVAARWCKTTRGAVCWVVRNPDMMPLTRWNQSLHAADPIRYKHLPTIGGSG